MFIKNLKISTNKKIIRSMDFKEGLNLIIDDTPTNDQKQTGNNVGKTTVLKLVNYCLGGDGKEIYTDHENKKDIYQKIKDFLIEEEVLITLTLVENLKIDSKKIIIERDFVSGKNSVIRINGEQILQDKFELKLKQLIFPNLDSDKPSFRQLISHNIRYNDESINNTLKTLNKYTTDVEYETLYLYLLKCTFNDADKKQSIIAKLKQEKNYKNRLESKQTKNSYKIALNLIENEINELNEKKSSFNTNKNFELDLNSLNEIRYQISKNSSIISKLTIRRDIILDAKKEMEASVSIIDIKQIKILYNEAKNYLEKITKTFEELVNYHNKMIVEKINFITKELPDIENKIDKEQEILNKNLEYEKQLIDKVSKSDSFEELNKIISSLTQKYRQKGEYESIISQINEVENNIAKLEVNLTEIDNILYSNEFEENLNSQLVKFNKYFSRISNELYGERYALKFEKEINKKTNKPVYKFSSFNLNMSTGKKQGEILCFDLAYILFADNEKIPTLHFLLNDKKELMHDNQLLKVQEFVCKNNIQLIVSMLKDKLPNGLINNSNIVIELSQENKLFKI
ncbi:hypothetical protein CEE64_01765 [Ureaplasma parvum]|uniref:DUF2326 domain-containing protein n=1 Tax=Ureaplasma parvum TaxID=134821 RepID=UPI000B4CC8C8|nr:DUF2326 domain-containing protein [Ureaplasma parvum]ASD25174.1 hypothetical protein CEE64_01765 [Ureaplasma parvum]